MKGREACITFPWFNQNIIKETSAKNAKGIASETSPSGQKTYGGTFTVKNTSRHVKVMMRLRSFNTELL